MTIEELKDLRETALEQITADYACYFSRRNAETIIKLVDAEIERQFELDGWLKVGNYLPNDDVASVLIHTKNGGVAEGQYYPTIKSWKQFRWSVEDAEVTHWRPMPEPPERGDE